MRYSVFAVILITCVAGIATAGLDQAWRYNEVIAIYRFEDKLDGGPREIHGGLYGDADIVKTNRGNVLKLTNDGWFSASKDLYLAITSDFSMVAWIGVKPQSGIFISLRGYDAVGYSEITVGSAGIAAHRDHLQGHFEAAANEITPANTAYLRSTDVDVADFKWHHVAFSRLGYTYTLFMDGKIVDRRYVDPISFISAKTSISVSVRDDLSSEESVFVDDLMFLQIGLSVYEIRGIMSSGLDAFFEAMPVDPADKVATTWGALKSR